MFNKKDLYLLMLEHGMEKLETGATENEITKYFKDAHQYELETTEKRQHFRRVLLDVFSSPIGQGSLGENKLFMTMEAYFKFIEYVELTEARKSSTKATYFASFAILVSIVSMVASIIFSVIQLNSPTTINEDQMEEIKKIQYDASPIVRELKEIKDAQEKYFQLIEKSYNKSLNRIGAKDAPPG
ncbi:MAG: hypothetical protein OEY66_10630 [Gammaproteobacteria bacterium]|nr:hypothetical protein [Gammaproteobacteria bacterium]